MYTFTSLSASLNIYISRMTFCSGILSPLDFYINTLNLYGTPPYAMQNSLVISVKIHPHFASLQDQRNYPGHP